MRRDTKYDDIDRQVCHDIRFADAIGQFAARISDPVQRAAVEAYAKWRTTPTYEAGTLDACFAGVPAAQWTEIIDAVNGIWGECWP